MPLPTSKQIEPYLKIALATAVLVLFILVAMLVQEYQHLRELNNLTTQESLLSTLHAKGPLTASDADSIASWMTFDYVNRLFNLPSKYLAADLAITDSRYPLLTIHEYAEDDTALGQLAALVQIQNAVRSYLTPKQ